MKQNTNKEKTKEKPAEDQNNSETKTDSNQEELNELKEKYAELENDLAKERANLLNYQNNERIRTEQRLQSAEKNLLFELIAIIDNFEHTIQSLKKNALPENDNFLKGIEIIYNQFKMFLSSRQCNSYDSLNETFDPSLHEAFEMLEDSSLPDNTIKEEICKGYTYKDNIIRPAKVKVIQNKQNN